MLSPRKPPDNEPEDSTQPPDLATTNYGSQVAYNYGSISNYFCHNSASHQHNLPSVTLTKESRVTKLRKKIEKAQALYKSEGWTEAKILFYEVLYTHDTIPEITETVLIKYNLAHAHFALAEFEDARTHFEDVADIREENVELFDKAISDSRYWLARTFYHQENYEKASLNLQVFIQSQDENDRSEAQQAITGRLWLGLTFERLEQYDSAQVQLETAYKMRRKAFGSQHLETLASRHHLANFLYKRKAYLEACEHFRSLLQAEERLNGPEKTQAIKTRCMLALCLAKVERYDDAEPHLQRVLTRLSSQSYLTNSEAKNYGLVCYWLGRIALKRRLSREEFKEAEKLLQRALNIFNHGNPDDSFKEELIDCRIQLAIVMNGNGQAAGAEQAFRQVMQVTEESQINSVATSAGLASALMAQGKFEETKSVLKGVVGIMFPLKNCSHTGTDMATCLHFLGLAHYELEELQEARDCFQRVIDAVPEKPNSFYNWSRHFLAMTLFKLREFEDARKHFQEGHRVGLQIHSRSSIDCQVGLSWALCELGRFEEAEPHIRQSLSVHTSLDVEPSPKTDFTIGRNRYYLGCIASHRKDMQETARLCSLALPMLLSCVGPDDSAYIECLYQIARALCQLQQHGEAQIKLQELLDTKSEHILVQNIRGLLAPYWLATSLIKQRKYAKAEPYLKQCLDVLESKPPCEDFTRQSLQLHLGLCLNRAGKFEQSCVVLQELLTFLPNDANESTEEYQYSRSIYGSSLFFLGRYQECSEYLETHVAAYESKWNYDELTRSLDRIYLAVSFCETNRQKEAQPLLERSVRQPGARPGTSEGVIKALGSYWLGRYAYTQRLMKVAEEHFQTARELLRIKFYHENLYYVDFECRFFLGRIDLDNKNYASAESIFRELAMQQCQSELHNGAVDSHYWLGNALQAQRKYDPARPIFQKIIDHNINGKFLNQPVPECYHQIAYGLWCMEDLSEAKKYYSLAIENTTAPATRPISRLYLARTNHRLNLLKEAKDGYILAIEESRNPTTLHCQYWLGKCQFDAKDWEGAVKYLLVAHDSGNEAWTFRLDCQHFLARSQFEMGQYEHAKGHFQTICDKNEKVTLKTPQTILDSQFYLGRCLTELQRPVEGKAAFIALLQRLHNKKPRNALAIMSSKYQLGRCYMKLREYNKAKIEFEAVLPFFKDRSADGDEIVVQVQYELGYLMKRERKWEEALELFQEALLNHKTVHKNGIMDVLAWQKRMARTLHHLKRYDEALNLLRTIVEVCKKDSCMPDQRLIKYQLALCDTLCQLNSFTEASQLAAEALKWQEQLSGVESEKCLPSQFMLAHVVFGLLDFEQTTQIFQKAFSRLESSRTARKKPLKHNKLANHHATYAISLFKCDRIESANSEALKAMDHDPSTSLKICQRVNGFAEAFGQLIIKRIKSRSAKHGFMVLKKVSPTVQQESPAVLQQQITSPSPLPVPTEQSPFAAVKQETHKPTTPPTIKQLPSQSSEDKPMVKKTPPPTKRKPDYLQKKYPAVKSPGSHQRDEL